MSNTKIKNFVINKISSYIINKESIWIDLNTMDEIVNFIINQDDFYTLKTTKKQLKEIIQKNIAEITKDIAIKIKK